MWNKAVLSFINSAWPSTVTLYSSVHPKSTHGLHVQGNVISGNQPVCMSRSRSSYASSTECRIELALIGKPHDATYQLKTKTDFQPPPGGNVFHNVTYGNEINKIEDKTIPGNS